MASIDDLFAADLFDELVCEDSLQDEFDEQFYDAVLRRNPDNLAVLRRLVEVVARRGAYEQALELNQRILALDAADSVAHYNQACSFSMLGNVESGLRALKRAVRTGYSDLAHLEADADLELLRSDLRYFDVLALFA